MLPNTRVCTRIHAQTQAHARVHKQSYTHTHVRTHVRQCEEKIVVPQEVKLAAKADTDLARRQYDQVITQARTALLTASISANKTLAAARTDAEITATVAQNQYASLLDKYTKFARLLNTTKAVNNLTVAGALAYLGNTLVGGEKQQIALDAPAKFSWKNEL